jgi:hypothetical protein
MEKKLRDNQIVLRADIEYFFSTEKLNGAKSCLDRYVNGKLIPAFWSYNSFNEELVNQVGEKKNIF